MTEPTRGAAVPPSPAAPYPAAPYPADAPTWSMPYQATPAGTATLPAIGGGGEAPLPPAGDRTPYGGPAPLPYAGQGGWPPPPGWWPPQQQEWPAPQPRRPRLMLAAVVVGLVLMLIVAAGAFLAGRAMRPTAQAPATTGQGNPDNPFSGGNGGNSGNSGNGGTATGPSSAQVSSIAAKVNPAVVDVNTELGYQNGRAAGTGIVLTSDGLVLTNNHVVAGATSISVTDVGNGKTYTATVVGYDRSDDIAVIKLSDASGLATASLGDSDKVKTNDPVVAIGNAGGTGGTPTAVGGTVSGLNQSITAQDSSSGVSEQLTGLIEVNANIQSGDSGGPLVNASGQIIGIDTAASTSFRYQASGGDGFAIPINKAMTLAKQIEGGQASSTVHIGGTAFLGISTGSQASGQNVTGAPVLGTVSGSPAASAGLTQGDVIVSLGGKTVDSPTTLTSMLDGYHPGDRVKVGWTDANGASHTTTMTLASGPVG